MLYFFAMLAWLAGFTAGLHFADLFPPHSDFHGNPLLLIFSPLFTLYLFAYYIAPRFHRRP